MKSSQKQCGARGLPWVLLALAVIAWPSTPLAQGTLSALETDVDQIARSARPSVVTVLAQRTVVRKAFRGNDLRTRVHTRVGSGVAVQDHEIVTTASVVQGAERILIRTTNGLQAPARVIGLDPIFNVAVLRVTSLRIPPLRFADQRPAQEGEWVMAIGTSPFRAQITQTVGTIAYRHREPRLAMLQLTNTVYPGYSGGAVLNARGELIGIVQGEVGTAGADPTTESRGGNSFVLPAETVQPVYQKLKTEGRVPHGYLGVTTRAASVESDTEKGLKVPIGALVESVQPGGPAARVGLRRGDLIVGFDGERVEYPEQLAQWVAATPPSTAIALVWVRDETPRSGRVALSESSELVPEWATIASANDGSGDQGSRIADLQRQILKLNRELERLKGSAGTTH